jgi:DnaJ-class molecular chaperone
VNKCTRCGRIFEEDLSACPSCGKKVSLKSIPPVEPQFLEDELDPYAILQIKEDADARDIEAAYRARTRYFEGDDSIEVAEMLMDIEWAYEILSDPEQRAQWDYTKNYVPPKPLLPNWLRMVLILIVTIIVGVLIEILK